jgi:tRNA pseudouridine55 synthase
LGTGGTMWNLERRGTGIFTLENAVYLDKVTKTNISEYVISLEDALAGYERLSFSSKYEKLLLNGVKVNNEFLLQNIELDKLYRVYLDNNRFIGIGIRDDAGFKIIKLLI